MTEWDSILRAALDQAVMAIEAAPGEMEVGELARFQPALALALTEQMGARISTGRRVASLPDWAPLPGGIDVLVLHDDASASAAPAMGAELKCDKLDETLWDIFKMASLRRMPGVDAAYVVAAARESKFTGRSDGAPLFNTAVDDAENWHTSFFFTEWPKAWGCLLAGGSGRPTRVPRMLWLTPIGHWDVPAFPGWQVRALRIENQTDHGWLVLNETGWPDHYDPDPYTHGPTRIADADLASTDLPQADADEDAFHDFALTTDGYEREGTLANCAQIANDAKQRWGETGELPHDLRTLRSCLFFEQRRAHHSGYGFNGRTLAYVRALVEEMRVLVSHPTE